MAAILSKLENVNFLRETVRLKKMFLGTFAATRVLESVRMYYLHREPIRFNSALRRDLPTQ